jgi:GTP-binding protein
MFIDHTKLRVKAGQGGSGACSFRREKHVPKGGPDGGDGGKGGSIILKVDPHLNTLIGFKYKNQYEAKHGQHGMGKKRHGKDAADLFLRVPPGTIVKHSETGKILADLVEPGQEFIAARGGRGGKGNARYTTSTHQAPREWEVGEAGEERWLMLELKVLADAGLVGKPNAGKSTLLSRISAAHPKIADYPFTTLQPVLGIVSVNEFKSFVMADIPGLIEDAHKGKGLGIQFLQHIERTRLLLYIIDPIDDDPYRTFQILHNELEKYQLDLVQRPSFVVLTKKDVWKEDFLKVAIEKFQCPIYAISAVTGEGIEQLKRQIWKELEKLKDKRENMEES